MISLISNNIITRARSNKITFMRINYLDIANQSDEECQAPQRDKYAKCQFQTVTCRLKYVAESAVNTINNNKNKKFIILEKALIL
jgi:hypothetical protein